MPSPFSMGVGAGMRSASNLFRRLLGLPPANEHVEEDEPDAITPEGTVLQDDGERAWKCSSPPPPRSAPIPIAGVSYRVREAQERRQNEFKAALGAFQARAHLREVTRNCPSHPHAQMPGARVWRFSLAGEGLQAVPMERTVASQGRPRRREGGAYSPSPPSVTQSALGGVSMERTVASRGHRRPTVPRAASECVSMEGIAVSRSQLLTGASPAPGLTLCPAPSSLPALWDDLDGLWEWFLDESYMLQDEYEADTRTIPQGDEHDDKREGRLQEYLAEQEELDKLYRRQRTESIGKFIIEVLERAWNALQHPTPINHQQQREVLPMPGPSSGQMAAALQPPSLVHSPENDEVSAKLATVV